METLGRWNSWCPAVTWPSKQFTNWGRSSAGWTAKAHRPQKQRQQQQLGLRLQPGQLMNPALSPSGPRLRRGCGFLVAGWPACQPACQVSVALERVCWLLKLTIRSTKHQEQSRGCRNWPRSCCGWDGTGQLGAPLPLGKNQKVALDGKKSAVVGTPSFQEKPAERNSESRSQKYV